MIAKYKYIHFNHSTGSRRHNNVDDNNNETQKMPEIIYWRRFTRYAKRQWTQPALRIIHLSDRSGSPTRMEINFNLFFLFCLGGIGLLWSALWFLIIFETPASHPRISREELEEIETAIGSSVTKKKPTYVPWFDIFTAPCVWAIVITHGTSVFGYFTIVNQLPTYMKEILHFDIKQVRICRLWSIRTKSRSTCINRVVTCKYFAHFN